ncbi:hypothetical protein HYH03_002387 [Edaphochlamys debaryana]|uniref:Guanylate cyclase n=1 Tax=Edaphochlamys debaryana TaxID=47281 RepID=A0A835YAM3_9CHLO|nr:hypothetical protein HYH03_002387 [Edaphochlamys debaryana]|eukprot:KAG2499440.1 hypothetical protein HYH03_002387 [Edaphochlamys debaryana]
MAAAGPVGGVPTAVVLSPPSAAASTWTAAEAEAPEGSAAARSSQAASTSAPDGRGAGEGPSYGRRGPRSSHSHPYSHSRAARSSRAEAAPTSGAAAPLPLAELAAAPAAAKGSAAPAPQRSPPVADAGPSDPAPAASSAGSAAPTSSAGAGSLAAAAAAGDVAGAEPPAAAGPAAAAPVAPAAATDPETAALAASLGVSPAEAAVVRLFEGARPSVVNISGMRAMQTFSTLDASRVPTGQGSGLLWGDRGVVLTCYHLVKGAAEVKVTLSDNTSYTAKVLGGDAGKDLAVLKLSLPKSKLRELQPVTPGSAAALRVGQAVYGISNPWGLGHTLSKGVVCGLGCELSAGLFPLRGLIATDAPADSGCSGGALLDSRGCLVGLLVAPPAGAWGGGGGRSYAVPLDAVRGLVAQILTYGRTVRPSLGITLAPAQVLQRVGLEGALVLEVPPGSPAAAAGLRPTHRDIFGDLALGDVITAMDGRAVRHAADVYDCLDEHRVGDRVKLEVLRDGKAAGLTVTLAGSDVGAEVAIETASRCASDGIPLELRLPLPQEARPLLQLLLSSCSEDSPAELQIRSCLLEGSEGPSCSPRPAVLLQVLPQGLPSAPAHLAESGAALPLAAAQGPLPARGQASPVDPAWAWLGSGYSVEAPGEGPGFPAAALLGALHAGPHAVTVVDGRGELVLYQNAPAKAYFGDVEGQAVGRTLLGLLLAGRQGQGQGQARKGAAEGRPGLGLGLGLEGPDDAGPVDELLQELSRHETFSALVRVPASCEGAVCEGLDTACQPPPATPTSIADAAPEPFAPRPTSQPPAAARPRPAPLQPVPSLSPTSTLLPPASATCTTCSTAGGGATRPPRWTLNAHPSAGLRHAVTADDVDRALLAALDAGVGPGGADRTTPRSPVSPSVPLPALRLGPGSVTAGPGGLRSAPRPDAEPRPVARGLEEEEEEEEEGPETEAEVSLRVDRVRGRSSTGGQAEGEAEAEAAAELGIVLGTVAGEEEEEKEEKEEGAVTAPPTPRQAPAAPTPLPSPPPQYWSPPSRVRLAPSPAAGRAGALGDPSSGPLCPALACATPLHPQADGTPTPTLQRLLDASCRRRPGARRQASALPSLPTTAASATVVDATAVAPHDPFSQRRLHAGAAASLGLGLSRGLMSALSDASALAAAAGLHKAGAGPIAAAALVAAAEDGGSSGTGPRRSTTNAVTPEHGRGRSGSPSSPWPPSARPATAVGAAGPAATSAPGESVRASCAAGSACLSSRASDAGMSGSQLGASTAGTASTATGTASFSLASGSTQPGRPCWAEACTTSQRRAASSSAAAPPRDRPALSAAQAEASEEDPDAKGGAPDGGRMAASLPCTASGAALAAAVPAEPLSSLTAEDLSTSHTGGDQPQGRALQGLGLGGGSSGGAAPSSGRRRAPHRADTLSRVHQLLTDFAAQQLQHEQQQQQQQQHEQASQPLSVQSQQQGPRGREPASSGGATPTERPSQASDQERSTGSLPAHCALARQTTPAPHTPHTGLGTPQGPTPGPSPSPWMHGSSRRPSRMRASVTGTSYAGPPAPPAGAWPASAPRLTSCSSFPVRLPADRPTAPPGAARGHRQALASAASAVGAHAPTTVSTLECNSIAIEAPAPAGAAPGRSGPSASSWVAGVLQGLAARCRHSTGWQQAVLGGSAGGSASASVSTGGGCGAPAGAGRVLGAGGLRADSRTGDEEVVTDREGEEEEELEEEELEEGKVEGASSDDELQALPPARAQQRQCQPQAADRPPASAVGALGGRRSFRWHRLHVSVQRLGAGPACGSGTSPSPAPSPCPESRVLVVSQVDVSEQVEAAQRTAALLQQEHKVLEEMLPRHCIEFFTLSGLRGGGRGRTPSALGSCHGSVTSLGAAGGPGGDMRSPTGTGAGEGGSGGGCGGAPEAGCDLRAAVTAYGGSVARLASLATSHTCVTVLFCDVVGFTSMCSAATPVTVMAFLNALYSRFDALTDIYKVYKVETIGDCYMVAGGLVAYDDDGYKSVITGGEDALHAVRVLEFAKAMLRTSSEVLLPHTGEPVQLRVGVHSGPVTSGVVGDRMPRFCLFGDTVNVASRMESTCRPGRIHVSAATHGRLRSEPWRDCGMTAVKGKGELRTYEWAGDEDAPFGDGQQLQRLLGVYL